jgi:AcrR family transcriptional regulator
MTDPWTDLLGAPDGADTPAPPREPLSKVRILAAALRLADEDGLRSLSMRRLAAELGFEPMSLYRHFPNKAAIIDGVIEAVWAELNPPSATEDPWERLRELSRSFRALALAHPHVFPALANRPVYLRGALRPVEIALETFEEAGFEGQSAVHAFVALVAYVYGFALREIAGLVATDEGEQLLWYDVARLPDLGFPAIVKLAPHFARYDYEASFEEGLESILSGLRATILTRRG